jgi:hypothetical protein
MNRYLKIFSFSVFIVLLILISCSKESKPTVTIEVIDGVEYVHNPNTPQFPNKTVKFEEELSIGGEDEQGNVILYQASDFTVDAHENIYISDAKEIGIKVFDPYGKYLHSIGRKGQGPGEFQWIMAFSFLPDGRLLVMDFRSLRTSIFESSGQFLESHQWIQNLYLNQILLTTNQSFILSVEDFGGPTQERKIAVNEYDFKSNSVRPFGEFVSQKRKAYNDGNINYSVPVPHSPLSLLAGDTTNNCIYHCLNNKYLIEVYDQTAKLIRKIDRPYEPVPYTSKDKEDFIAQYENHRIEGMKKLAREVNFPIVKSVASRLYTDDQGNLWVKTNEQRKDDNITFTAYDIFNKEGIYDARVWCDLEPAIILKGKMYRMHLDEETGYRCLKRYRIVWNE